MSNEEQTKAELLKVPVKVTFKVLVNGEPAEQREVNLELPTSARVFEEEGTIEWHPILTAGEQAEGSVWTGDEDFPFVLKMSCEEVRNLILNERGGTAEVELPLSVETAKGKQLIRGKEGRPHAVIERPLTLVSWDRSQKAA